MRMRAIPLLGGRYKMRFVLTRYVLICWLLCKPFTVRLVLSFKQGVMLQIACTWRRVMLVFLSGLICIMTAMNGCVVVS